MTTAAEISKVEPTFLASNREAEALDALRLSDTTMLDECLLCRNCGTKVRLLSFESPARIAPAIGLPDLDSSGLLPVSSQR